jgi:hypothetical protein
VPDEAEPKVTGAAEKTTLIGIDQLRQFPDLSGEGISRKLVQLIEFSRPEADSIVREVERQGEATSLGEVVAEIGNEAPVLEALEAVYVDNTRSGAGLLRTISGDSKLLSVA